MQEPPPTCLSPFAFKQEEAKIIAEEIQSLLKKGAIRVSKDQEGFTSNIFLVPKSEGKWRLILNLKSLNKFVRYEHFKMEDIRSVKDLLNKGDYMCKLDLKDAYLSIPIDESDRFLRFNWQGTLYEYTALPFGLSAAPRAFTKVLKPVLAALRAAGIRLVAYLDDFLIIGKTKKEAEAAFQRAKNLLQSLGFVINLDKSQNQAAQVIEFLGFIIDSKEMVFRLPHARVKQVRVECKRVLHKNQVSVRELAHVVGLLVAIYSLGSSSCTLALPCTTRPEKRGSVPPPLIRFDSGPELSESEGSTVVDTAPQRCEWPANSSATSHHDHRVGRIEHGMGSPLWIPQDQRPVVSGGGPATYQLQRAVSSFPSFANLWKRQGGDTCQAQGRQHYSDVLHQSDGGHTLPTADGVDIRPMELEPGEEDHAVSRTPTWQVEPGGRPGIQDARRQFRVEAEASGVQESDGANGPMSGRSVCITSDSTVGGIHELETRPRSNGNRCTVPIVESDQGICLPTFFLNWKMPDQSAYGESPRDGADRTNMANSALVPSVGLNGHPETDTDAGNARSVSKPQGRKSSPDQPRISESSRVACIRRSLSAEGIPETASQLILASWRSSTEGAYSSCWRQWEKWCAKRGLEALRSPLSAILKFLALEFLQGKQYRTINSYRSAISMTHGAIDVW